MPEKATRRSVKKSRGGCSRCKSQHLKCDEKKPSCGRCERLGVECPGYSKPIRWSRKHEVTQSALDFGGAGSAVATPQETFTDPFSPLSPMQDYEWLQFDMPSMGVSPALSPVDAVPEADDLIASLEPMPRSSQLVWPSADAIFGTDYNLPMSQAVQQQPRKTDKHAMMQSLGARLNKSAPQLQRSLLHEPYELISYYFKTIPALYSIFDSHRNPYRSAVSSLFGHSLAVNLAAQSMAAACLVEVHPRFVSIGARLRREALEAVRHDTSNSYHSMLALSMSGPTGNWFEASDLGISSYYAMRDRLDVLVASGSTDKEFSFFREAMVMWEMYLAYANPGILRPSLPLPPTQQGAPVMHEPHAWTGVARDTMAIVRDIGKLVRSNRLRSLNQKFTSQAQIYHMGMDLTAAREYERRLLACMHPVESEVLPTEDEATPVWHLTTMAELFRYAGLLQLYRVFPDLLAERLRGENDFLGDELVEFGGNFEEEISDQRRNEWLTTFALEALRLLEPIALESSTKDFQPFLLVTFASELRCKDPDGHGVVPNVVDNTILFAEDTTTLSRSFVETAMMRKFAMDRLTSFLRMIPPKPIRVCIDIVKEVWRKMDQEGQQNVYWLDTVIEHGWETIMA